MFPEAVFRDFPAKPCRKLAVSGRNLSGNARSSTHEFGDRIGLTVLTGSCRFRAKPDNSGHRIRSTESCFHEISRIARKRLFTCRIVRLGLLKPMLKDCMIWHYIGSRNIIYVHSMTEWLRARHLVTSYRVQTSVSTVI